MLAYITGLEPGGITHTIGDAHIYSDHISQVCTQLERKPYNFPQVTISKDFGIIKQIEDFKFSHFVIENYAHHSKISAKMNV